MLGMSAVAVIPARYGSTRLPGKPLLDRTGLPLVVHVAEAASRAERIERVLIATDDHRIADAVAAHGYEAVMTRSDHVNGTSRIAEVAEALPAEVEVIVNVQGDEPLVEPALIDALAQRVAESEEPMVTVASPFAEGEDAADANIVKVVLDRQSRAMYFSRSVIPHGAAEGEGALKHLGLYAYRRGFLPVYVGLEPTPAERAERLEQLRALEHGHRIGVIVARVAHHGIDTPAQYDAFVAWYRRQRGAVSEDRSL